MARELMTTAKNLPWERQNLVYHWFPPWLKIKVSPSSSVHASLEPQPY